ncbi:MAG: hypothetical protein ACXVBY_16870 [Isosphaeraceae bacterium]
MTESPLIREIVGDRFHKVILKLLATRFGPVSPELEAEVRSILDESVLDSVMELAAFSPDDLKHFQAEMRAIPRPPEPWDPADQSEPSVVKRGVTGETGDRQPRSENQSAQP